MAVFFLQCTIFLQIQVSKQTFMKSFPWQFFFQGEIFLQIQVSKHAFMRSFPRQFFPRYNLSPNPSFQTPVVGKLARVTVKPFLCSKLQDTVLCTRRPFDCGI